MTTKADLNGTTALPRPITMFFVKDKGGVNNSHNAMATGTLLRLSGGDTFTAAIVDLDGSTGTTVSKMGNRGDDGRLLLDQEGGVIPIDLFDREKRMRIFDIVEVDDRFLLLDGPAAALKMLKEINPNLSAADWVAHNTACGRDLIVVVSITPHLASITNVASAIEMFGPSAQYVVIRSMRDCRPHDYVLWDKPDFTDRYANVVSGNSKARLEAAGGIVLDMPALSAGVLAYAEAKKVPFTEAISSPFLNTVQRLSIRNWLTDWSAQLDRIRGPLGLDAGFEWIIR
jgi:hypothetical protein